jgi:hypothetical protein
MCSAQELNASMDRLSVTVLRVKAERDELLAALKCAMPFLRSSFAYEEVEIAEAAIAKAEGK